jgi:para-aminobenzoate synthetase component 1
MIVDLLRNDLFASARTTASTCRNCALESYEFVQHLVSSVSGKLRPGVSAIDAGSRSSGGSITGAPKIRAMEVIAELEPTRAALIAVAWRMSGSTARWTRAS